MTARVLSARLAATTGVASPGITVLAIIAVALLVRAVAAIVLSLPVESDALAYFTMADTLANGGVITDQFGQHAFYSAGYPLLLAPFFAVMGSSLATALAVNLMLAAVSVALVHALGQAVSGRRDVAGLAALAYALWLPAIWNASGLAKENLSTPLLLGLALAAIMVAQGRAPRRAAALGGLCWGAGLVTGGSSIPLCAGMAVALLILWRSGRSIVPPLRAGLCFAGAALIVLAPWLVATERMTGAPVLTTNTAFNLYLGNNPAATGRFVSIAATPMGPGWQERRIALGEIGTAAMLQQQARDWIATHPGHAGELAALKLAYFWQPNIPDAADFTASKAVSAFRILDLIQYLAILILAGIALGRVAAGPKWIIVAMVAGFWVIHAAAYIIPRYRDPVIPLLIVLAAVPVAQWLAARWSGGGARDAA